MCARVCAYPERSVSEKSDAAGVGGDVAADEARALRAQIERNYVTQILHNRVSLHVWCLYR